MTIESANILMIVNPGAGGLQEGDGSLLTLAKDLGIRVFDDDSSTDAAIAASNQRLRQRIAVHHGVGETAVLVDPVGQRAVRQPGQRHHRLAHDRPVALQVVAALQRHRSGTGIPTQPERRDDGAKGGARLIRVGGVVADVGVVGIKALACGVDEIPPLGHRHGNDADCGVGHLRDQGAIAVLDRDIADHGADHLGRGAGGIKLDQGGQVVLRRQLLSLRLVKGAHNPRR